LIICIVYINKADLMAIVMACKIKMQSVNMFDL
jgi:hypothetical protein